MLEDLAQIFYSPPLFWGLPLLLALAWEIWRRWRKR
jgi:hypothetical protein